MFFIVSKLLLDILLSKAADMGMRAHLVFHLKLTHQSDEGNLIKVSKQYWLEMSYTRQSWQ